MPDVSATSSPSMPACSAAAEAISREASGMVTASFNAFSQTPPSLTRKLVARVSMWDRCTAATACAMIWLLSGTC